MPDENVKRLVNLIKQEASKDELFSMEKIKSEKLYKILAEQYDNIDDVCAMALKKSTLYEHMRSTLDDLRKSYLMEQRYRVINEPEDKQMRYLMFIMSFKYLDLSQKFRFRYSLEEMQKLALESVKKYPVKSIWTTD